MRTGLYFNQIINHTLCNSLLGFFSNQQPSNSATNCQVKRINNTKKLQQEKDTKQANCSHLLAEQNCCALLKPRCLCSSSLSDDILRLKQEMESTCIYKQFKHASLKENKQLIE